MINKIYKKSRQGFTLVETLIAVLVLSLAITGPLTIAQKGLQAALISKDQIAAFYLAQDAIEYIRYARDTNCLAASAAARAANAADTSCQAQTGQWLAGNGNSNQTINLTPCVSTNGSSACTVDMIVATQPAACTLVNGLCSAAINYDSTKNWFTYGSAPASMFRRTITIKNDPAGVSPNEADVSVTISWNDPLPHKIIVNESLFNWQ